MRHYLWAGLLLLAAGCAAAPAPKGQVEVSGRPTAQGPAITAAWAPEAVREGTYWRLYLSAADPGCAVTTLYADVEQLGFGSYRLQQIQLPRSDRCGLHGQLTFPVRGSFLWGARFTVTVWVEDATGRKSQQVTFPVVVDGAPEVKPPAPYQGPEFQRVLGSIDVQLRSPTFDGGPSGFRGLMK